MDATRPIEGLVHAADGQQHIEPSLLGIYTAIGEDDDATPLLDRLPSLSVQLFQSPARAPSLIRRIGDRQGRNTLLVAQPGKAGTAENGILQLDDFGVVLPQNRLGSEKSVELAEVTRVENTYASLCGSTDGLVTWACRRLA